jgi:predicted  nucleic acid-binding Zn-ribbon protein
LETSLVLTHLREIAALYEELAVARGAVQSAPERADHLAELDREHRDDLAGEQDAVAARRSEARRLEGELRDLEARLQERREQRGGLAGPQQVLALQRELAGLRERRDALERELLAAWETTEREEAALGVSAQRTDAARTEIATRAAGVAQRGARARAAVEEIDAELAGRLARLPVRVAKKLERLSARWPDPIAGLNAGACASCGYALPAQMALDADREANLVICQGCGRFVVVRRGLRAKEWT